MGKEFCIPTYLPDEIKFGNTIIPLAEIKSWLFDDLLTTSEIAQLLTDRVHTTVSRAAVRKLSMHYNLVFTKEQKQLKGKKRAEKTKQNLLATQGITNVFQRQDIKEKATQTKLERYNDPHYVNVNKAKQTSLQRYGVTNYSMTAECKEKIASTNFVRYGTKAPAQNAVVLQKMKDTCIDRYGTDNYWKSEKFKDFAQQKYFAEHPQLTEIYKQIYKDTDKLEEFINQLSDKTSANIAKEFGISQASVNALLAKHGLNELKDLPYNTSHFEQEIAEYIGQDICELNNRTILEGAEIDIYIPTKKLGIEFNGTYWHSLAVNHDKNYHFNKSKLAEEKGIRLIHIYEYEWRDPIQQQKIKMMLDIALGRVQNKIFARKCTIKQIDNKEAKILNEQVHLQGHRSANITYGLFYNDELVQLMSFSKTQYNKNLKTENSWEIIRGCPGSNNIVIGGVSKLFSRFIKDINPDYVFSYCDFNKFNGVSYEALGMKFIGYTGPDMKWIMPDGSVKNRQPKNHKQLKELSIGQIFGAGSKKYLWTSPSLVK